MLHLKSWYVEKESISKEKTKFSLGRGLWHFKAMPLGLWMERVLKGLACLFERHYGCGEIYWWAQTNCRRLLRDCKLEIKSKEAGVEMSPGKVKAVTD